MWKGVFLNNCTHLLIYLCINLSGSIHHQMYQVLSVGKTLFWTLETQPQRGQTGKSGVCTPGVYNLKGAAKINKQKSKVGGVTAVGSEIQRDMGPRGEARCGAPPRKAVSMALL